MVASPPLRPEIKDVMQVDVRQQGRGNAALRRPHLWPGHLPVFHHPSLQPFADQADHAAVADPMLDKTDRPLVVDRIEESGNLGVQYPVHPGVPIPTASASNASCGPRPGRNPYENPRKSSS